MTARGRTTSPTQAELARAAGRTTSPLVAPGLRVLFTSGHERGGFAREERVDTSPDMLAKPFTLVALAVRVRETLDRTSPVPPTV